MVFLETGMRQYQVIDGQQRLVTLTLLLVIIRHKAAQEAGDALTEDWGGPGKSSGTPAEIQALGIVEAIQKLIFEAGNPILNLSPRYRLSLAPKDNHFWETRLLPPARTAELLVSDSDVDHLSEVEARLVAVARTLDAYLYGRSVAQLSTLLNAILTRTLVIVSITSDVESAFRIFSTLNARGLPLSEVDLLKADIIGALPVDRTEQYSRIWEGYEKSLTMEGLKQVFEVLRTIRIKDYMNEGLLNYFLKEFNPGPTDQPMDFMDTWLFPAARIFELIFHAGRSSEETNNGGSKLLEDTVGDSHDSGSHAKESLTRLLRWLRRLPFDEWIPAAVAFLRSEQRLNERLKFFQELEKLCVCLMVMRSNVQKRRKRLYTDLLTHLEKGVKKAFDEGSPLKLTNAELEEFSDRLVNQPLYAPGGSNTVVVYLLLRLDEMETDGGVGAYELRSGVSVEHVLPQKPSQEWVNDWPDARERSQSTHFLGNLALLSLRKNFTTGNVNFQKKKTLWLRDGMQPFALTTALITGFKTWKHQDFIKRHMSLTVKLLKLYNLPTAPPPGSFKLGGSGSIHSRGSSADGGRGKRSEGAGHHERLAPEPSESDDRAGGPSDAPSGGGWRKAGKKGGGGRKRN